MGELKIERIETEIEILDFYELTENEQKELNDYDGYKDSSFFRYRGNVYDMSDFMKFQSIPNDAMKDYHAYKGETYFSGVLIKLSDCGDSLTVAQYWS